jgi:pimeloyl-ACP methyl ester carboxylesterase
MWLDYKLFATAKKNPVFQRRMKQMMADSYRTWGPTPAPIVWNWPAKPSIERLSEIKQPTLIIVGDMDVPGTIAISDALKEKIGGARKIVIKGVSHHLNMEKPKEFNKAVLDFLKEK